MTSHKTTTHAKVKRLKLYVDALLTDLLAINRVIWFFRCLAPAAE